MNHTEIIRKSHAKLVQEAYEAWLSDRNAANLAEYDKERRWFKDKHGMEWETPLNIIKVPVR